jgi:hypothetical protein
MDAQEKAELGVILGQLLVPENTTRAQAEQRFKVRGVIRTCVQRVQIESMGVKP